MHFTRTFSERGGAGTVGIIGAASARCKRDRCVVPKKKGYGSVGCKMAVVMMLMMITLMV